MTDLEALAARVEAKDVAAIAAGLTKAQGAVVRAAEENWRVPSAKGLGSKRWQAIYNAKSRGLIELGPNLFRLTPLGLAVKAHLTAGATHDR